MSVPGIPLPSQLRGPARCPSEVGHPTWEMVREMPVFTQIGFRSEAVTLPLVSHTPSEISTEGHLRDGAEIVARYHLRGDAGRETDCEGR